MQLGQRHRQVIGLAICGLAFVVAALVPRGDSATPTSALRGISAAVETGADSTGALAATVTWPSGAAERSDICVVVFDEDGGVAEELVGGLEPVPGQPVAGRWTAAGLTAGRYTVHAAPCVRPAAETRPQVEPQYLGGGDDAAAARWVEIASGDRVDVGTIALRRSDR